MNENKVQVETKEPSLTRYTEPQKKRRNFNNSIRHGKQSNYFFSLNCKYSLQRKVLVLITKS